MYMRTVPSILIFIEIFHSTKITDTLESHIELLQGVVLWNQVVKLKQLKQLQ